jgi:hypothetical protein
MSVKKLPLVNWDIKVWEEQPWDTRKSYDCFFLYYFPQPTPRNVSKAYRDANPKGLKRDNRQAPSNWRRWAAGQDGKGDKKYYRMVGQSGDISVLPVPTWEQRAAAWDEHLRQREIKKAEQARSDLIKRVQTTTKVALENTILAWGKYKPSGQESLSELISSTRQLATTIDMVHQGLFTGDEPIDADQVAVEDTVSDIDRVEAIGEMILLATKRQAEAEKESEISDNGRGPDGQPPENA